MEKRIDWWNVFFIILFIAIVYIAYRLVAAMGGVPMSVSVWDSIIMLLAAFRLTRLVVYDAITRWFRDLFKDGKEYTFYGTIKVLITCPWCMGLWFAMVVATIYFAYPALWFFIFVLALGGAVSFVQVFVNLVGWNAEHKKAKTILKTKKIID